MFSGGNTSHFNPKNTAIWLSLAFQAGIINTGGYLACHRFVSHTTGFATLFGVEVGQLEFMRALGMLSVPGFYLAGSMISAFFVDQRMLLFRRPQYSIVFFLMTSLMGLVTIGGFFGIFGVFGEELRLVRDYALLAVLCLTCGLQNATITTAFGAIVRTTHLTGITTDLGIGLVRIVTGTYKNSKDDEVKAVWMRIGIIGFFALGSCSAFFFDRVEYLGFAIPTLISTILWYSSIKSASSVRKAT